MIWRLIKKEKINNNFKIYKKAVYDNLDRLIT
jgi:hypothetical protein